MVNVVIVIKIWDKILKIPFLPICSAEWNPVYGVREEAWLEVLPSAEVPHSQRSARVGAALYLTNVHVRM